MARITKKLAGEIWSWTTSCWEHAKVEYYAKVGKPIPTYNGDIAPEDKEALDQIYRQNLCSRLTTQQLELVIEAYKKGKHRRAPVTMNAIVTELLERQMQTK